MFKSRYLLPALAAALFCSVATHAQAPAGAPTGSTGLCNDGTYYSGATKAGACRGHQGVKTWWGPAAPAKTAAPAPTATPAPAAQAAPASTPAPTPTPAPAAAAKTAPVPATKPATAAAPGGGPGLVWVNTASKVYHCPTDRYYGKTKAGKYLSESAAQAEGDKPNAGKKCF